MLAQIYKTLQYFITARIPEVKYLTLFNNQYDIPLDNRSFDLPAVLIEILPIRFNDLLNAVQMAEVKVNLHIGTPNNIGYDRNDKMQDAGLAHLELIDKMYIGLNNVNSQDLPNELKNELFIQAGFRRNRIEIRPYNSDIYRTILEGSFILFDYSALKTYTELELTDIVTKMWYNEPYGEEAQAKIIDIIS